MKTGKYNFDRVWYEFDSLSVYTGEIWPDLHDELDWCKQNFGPNTLTPDAWSRWYVNGWIFRFRDEKDYLIFLLRWS